MIRHIYSFSVDERLSPCSGLIRVGVGVGRWDGSFIFRGVAKVK